MSRVAVVVTCVECPATITVHPYSALTRLGTLRLHAHVPYGWAVNGYGGYCPKHSDEVRDSVTQKTPWGEVDLQQAYLTIEEEGGG